MDKPYSIDPKKLLSGDIRTLAKAITLVESTNSKHRVQANKLLEDILTSYSDKKTLRIGITGTPGVGKSTFIEAFGLYLVDQGKKVAVLTIDPSSPISGGSILGDKTRMEKLSRDERAYIRPSAAGTSLGGVGGKTREAIYLCEATGFDIILVETVGVGQSEHEVASMVDFFCVLSLPNAGDELQGIKKGILELADAIIINKSDGDGKNQAIRSMANFEGALGLISPTSFWKPRVMSCSALYNDKIDSIWDMICEYQKSAIENSEIKDKRNSQKSKWIKRLIFDMLEMKIYSNPKASSVWQSEESKVLSGETTAYLAAQAVVDQIT